MRWPPTELADVAQAYATAAANARAAGFDAVELHGAHGYLLDEFLWERTNRRTDGYGGSLAARTRFPADVVAAVRAAVGPDFPILYRFSQWKTHQYDARIAETPAELEAILTPLIDAGVDVLHPSTRRHYLPAFPDSDPYSEPVRMDPQDHRSSGDRRRIGRAGDRTPGWQPR